MSAGGGNYFPSAATTFLNGASSTDFVAALGGAGITTTGLSQYQANYIEFEGYTGSSTATFALNELGYFPNGGNSFAYADGQNDTPIGICGVQVISACAVPEPATIWSAALGLMGLVGFQVRRSGKS